MAFFRNVEQESKLRLDKVLKARYKEFDHHLRIAIFAENLYILPA